MFRKKYLDYFETAYRNNEMIFPGQTKALGSARGFKDLLNRCYANRWVVDIRKPIDQPEYVLDYLGRYTHRVATSNNRILSYDNGAVLDAKGERWSQLPGYPKAKEPGPLPYCIRHSS